MIFAKIGQERYKLNKLTKNDKNNITLIGFMASGKSTIGQLLAKTLNLHFIDTDAVIEKQEGMSISELFALHGEDYFRKVEKDLIRVLLQQSNQVISTGGGLPCRHGNMDIIQQSSTSFYLKLGIQQTLLRLENDQSRPLLDTKDKKKRISKLLQQRRPIYTKADFTVMAYRTPEQILKIILKHLN